MRRVTLLLVTPMLLATVPALGGAQHLSPLTLNDQQETTQGQGSAGSSILAGIGLGLAGFAIGGLTASGIASDCTSHELCQLEAAFYGAAAGGTFGMALGVHLGNKRRGNLALDFVTGAAIWGAGIGIAAASDWDDTVTPVAFVMIPIVQLVSTVAVERAVGQSRLRRQRSSVSLVPRVDGGAMLVGRVAF